MRAVMVDLPHWREQLRMPRGTMARRMRACSGSGVKCRRRMANSTGSVRELELWVDGRGEAFFESAPDSVKGAWLMNECVGDGVEEELEDFEDAGGGDVLVVVGFGSGAGF